MKFDEWLYEVENFNLRLERLYDEVETPDKSRLIKWLQAAYNVGYEHRDNELMDDGK